MRVLRHIPGHFPPPVEILGLDYNPQTVKWCSEHFPSIRFLRNELVPPLPLEDGSIDVIYALSVFTHLSEQLHYAYVADLFRCLKSGGILIVSLHGDRSRNFLSVEEVRSYDAGKLVIRGRAVEGKRPFVAYHSPGFVRGRMFAGREILFHDNTDRISGFHQDLWVVR
jgi:SAM-dependent methyltransferase